MDKPYTAVTSVRLQSLMRERGLRQADVLRLVQPYAAELGVKFNRSDLSQYVSGKVRPGQEKLAILCRALQVSPAWLMGYDAPVQHPDLLPVSTQRVPLLGEIACGEPIFAAEDFSASVLSGASLSCDFALRCRGDSMIDARILDGDTVFIRRQDVVDDGAIAAVLIDDEATLKRVYHLPDGRLELRAANARYAPIVIGGENETRGVRILGKAVGFQSAVL